MADRIRTDNLVGFLALFTSWSTLLCCALPSLFVLIGLGATVASMVSAMPWLIAFSHYKSWTFGIAGLLIAANFVYVFHFAPKLRGRSQTCSQRGANSCGVASRLSTTTVLWVSACIYLIGFVSAYLLGPVLRCFG
jgi:mercuric ion transport protein